ncbi:MAG: efflux RND transporter periplasmic adaptor subunit [Planctomycetes bacterium]|nr:efflux RND transporter periplasmic adaptor subunit [Planctomycetota bacterium]
MATTSPFGSTNFGLDATAGAAQVATGPGATRGTADTSSEPIDAELVQETKNQIRGLVQEITRLAHSDLAVEAFFDEFLRRVVTAMAAVGGAVWSVEGSGLTLVHQINVAGTDVFRDEASRVAHERLLEQTARSDRPALVPPRSGSMSDGAGNPTHCLVIVAAFPVDEDRRGLIEIFQRAGGGPATQRGYLRFVSQMGDLAADYFRNRRLRRFADQESLWRDLEQFLCEAHRHLDPKSAAISIANEGRSLIGCDRLTVAIRKRGRIRIAGMSGVESIEGRSTMIHHLERLTALVTATRRPFWLRLNGERPPPQVERELHAYLDQSHASAMGIIPLFPPGADSAASSREEPGRGSAAHDRRPFGALIAEQFREAKFGEGLVERVEVVARHSELALGNALVHSRIPFFPLWRELAHVAERIQDRLPRFVLGLIAAAIAIAWLVFWPADFRVAATGRLRPVDRHDVFAQVDGEVEEVLVRHGESVEPGEPLLRMRSTELDVQLAELLGLRNRTSEQIAAKEQLLLRNARLDPVVQDEIAGELEELRQILESTDQRLTLVRGKSARLTVTSPAKGQVVTWQVDELLRRRPVQRGQALLSVVDPDGAWEVELYVPERRLGHMMTALHASDDSLPVRYRIRALPGNVFEGRVVEIQRIAEMRGESGNSVAVRVAVDRDRLPQRHNDASVDGRIECGRRSIGYILFQDLLETIHSQYVYWF